MGKLRNLFFEPIEPTNAYPDVGAVGSEYYDETPDTPVNTDGVTQDGFVQDVYNKNELSDFSRSIFKVEEVMNSLPKEMATAVKKTTVHTILTSFGITVDEVLRDAERRKDVIAAAVYSVTNENNDAIHQNEAEIEQKKIEIGELEKDNAEKEEFVKDIVGNTEKELERIDALIEFIEGDEA